MAQPDSQANDPAATADSDRAAPGPNRRSPLSSAAKRLNGAAAEIHVYLVDTCDGFATGLRVDRGRLVVLDEPAVQVLHQLLVQNRALIEEENRATLAGE